MSFSPLNSPRQWQRIGAYDLEWKRHTGAVTLAGFYAKGRYRASRTVDEMLDGMLTDEHRGTYFYAHSGGRHDMTHVISALARRTGLAVECHVVGSRLVLCIVRGPSKGEVWYLADSFAVLKSSLKEIGKSIGLPKIEGDTTEDTDDMTPEELYARNKRDCEIVVRALELYQEDLWARGGELKHTIGACAMSLFRRTYLKKEVRTSKIDNAWCRGAYHAARVEVFLHYDENGIVRDINSAYPWAMTQGLPGELIRVDASTTDSGFWCADATVVVPEGHIPPLPFRHKSRIYFPVGRFRTKLTRLMSDLLYEYGGYIERIHEVHHYAPGLEELGAFASDMYRKRLEAKKRGDNYASMTYKFEGNTPYGKLAENSEKTGIVINPVDLPPMKDKIAPGIYKVSSSREVPHAHVIAAVWITDLIKCLLTRELWKLDERAAYCDTDCTHGADLGQADEDGLGGWKLEYRYASGDRIAAKLYLLQGADEFSIKGAAKGFAMPNLRVENPEILRRNIAETKRVFVGLKQGMAREYEWFSSPREAMRGEIDPITNKHRELSALVTIKRKGLSRQCPICFRHLDTMGAGCPEHDTWAPTVLVSGKRARLGDNATRPWNVKELGRKGL